MPLQNRVLPTQEIVALSARGTLTGNRGILHRDDRTLGRARWTHKAWICCTLDWKGLRRRVMTGRTWTELFFLDEATALAAGHRPCARCRRTAYMRFQDAWTAATGERVTAQQIDAALHAARLAPDRRQRRHRADCGKLPDGTLILWQDRPHLVRAGAALPWTPDGYGAPADMKKGTEVIVLTPAPLVAVLQAGYAPAMHDTVPG
ncbi:hypothetical protein ACOI1H_03780 [Loktanella sp. DJP18]|uniref:hypothetical protein n=1 Tax=Loktanella sp. DJP18 TaxID=3409788 RepID=UPI003BB63CD6